MGERLLWYKRKKKKDAYKCSLFQEALKGEQGQRKYTKNILHAPLICSHWTMYVLHEEGEKK